MAGMLATLAVNLDGNPGAKPGLAGRLTMPSSVDLLPALLFTACFAPPAFP